MARRMSGSRMSGSQRRKLVWADQTISHSAVTTIQETDLLSNYRSISGAASAGCTVMAVIFQHSAGKSGGTGTLGNGFQLGLQVTNVTGGNFSPLSQEHMDWLWNKRYFVGDLALSLAYESDHEERIRSRRKCEEVEDTLVMYFEPILAGATGINYQCHVRTLLALP